MLLTTFGLTPPPPLSPPPPGLGVLLVVAPSNPRPDWDDGCDLDLEDKDGDDFEDDDEGVFADSRHRPKVEENKEEDAAAAAAAGRDDDELGVVMLPPPEETAVCDCGVRGCSGRGVVDDDDAPIPPGLLQPIYPWSRFPASAAAVALPPIKR